MSGLFDKGKKAPDGDGIWIQGAGGLWYNVGTPSDLTIDYFATLDLKPIVPKLKPDTPANAVELTLEAFMFKPMDALKDIPADVISKLAAEHTAKLAKYLDDEVAKVLFGDPTATPPAGLLNAPIGSKSTDPPLKVEELFNLFPIGPPYYSPPPLEEPPPVSWRDVEAAFVAASGRIAIEAPTGDELEESLADHFGSTDPDLKAKA